MRGAGSHEMDMKLGQHGRKGSLKSFLCWNPWKDTACIHGHTYGRGLETGKRKRKSIAEKRKAETEDDKERQEQSFSSFPGRESHAGKPTQAPWSEKKRSVTQASGRKTQHWEGAANNPKRKAVVNKWLRSKKS